MGAKVIMEFYKIKLKMVKESTEEYDYKSITTPNDIVEYINSIENYDMSAEENLIAVCLNNKNKIIAYSEIAKGTIDTCQTDIKSIFKTVLMSNATKFILVHNHPTGNSKPSNEDIEITKRVKKASKIMQISFLDHIVIGDNEMTSIFEYMGR